MAGPAGCGYSEAEVWDWTPGKISAMATKAQKLQKRERAHQLSIAASAARGKPDDIKGLLKEWSAD